MMKCLFIGGSSAGKMIDVDIRMTHVNMPAKLMTPARYSDDSGYPSISDTFEYEIYKFSVMTDRLGARHICYVKEDSGCPLAQLMAFYAGGDHDSTSAVK